ncbi:hypothetical protein ABZP36_030066, partial [Zizania latifolia]
MRGIFEIRKSKAFTPVCSITEINRIWLARLFYPWLQSKRTICMCFLFSYATIKSHMLLGVAFQVLISILANGEKQRDMATLVEGNLGSVEQDLIQDYVEDSDNLVLLHDQINDCDIILSQIGSLLTGFQLVETKLAKFVEEIVAPPGLVSVIIDGEVNDGYVKSLEILSKKLRFAQVDPMINASKSLKDIKPELERLRQKALSKVSNYITEILFAMRKPGTNIQILQQNLVQKYRTATASLWDSGSMNYDSVLYQTLASLLVLPLSLNLFATLFCFGVNATDVLLTSKVLSADFQVYIEALEKSKLNIGVSSDMTGYDTNIIDLITRGREHLRNHRFMFSLGERAIILKVFIHLWPCFKIVFDMYLQSLYQYDVKTLWVDGSHPHHVVRCYVEFTASLVQLNAECGDSQVI